MRDLMKMIDRVLGDNQTESLNGAYMQENVFLCEPTALCLIKIRSVLTKKEAKIQPKAMLFLSKISARYEIQSRGSTP